MTDNEDTFGAETYMNPDRKRGILTRNDRELLIKGTLRQNSGESKNKQQLRDARYRIRNRVKAALFDICLLALMYPDKERDTILGSIEKNVDDNKVGAIGLVNLLCDFAVSFVHIGVDNGYIEESVGGDQELEDFLQRAIRGAILHAEEDTSNKTMTDVDVDIRIRRKDFDEEKVLHELVYGSPTQEQFFFYTHHGDMKRLQEMLQEHDTAIVFTDPFGEEHRVEPDNEIITRRI